MTPENLTLESDFAEMLGLKRDAVKTVRDRELKEGEDFHRVQAGIAYTAAAVEKMLHHLATEPGEPQQPEEAVLEVVRQVPNPMVVMASLLDPTDPTRRKKMAVPQVLRVPFVTAEDGTRSNLFRAGMQVKARHVQGAVWSYVGPRPRFVGDIACCAPRPQPQATAAAEEVQP